MTLRSRRIPTTMVSQHPDHANVPYWHTSAFLKTQDETEEAFRSWADLGAQEYKWDWEGKLVDESVLERLWSTYFEFFKDQPIGRDVFLTFRLPNPSVETEFRIGRAFMGILSAAGLAQQVGFDQVPLFEAILPMTETADDILAIQQAFQEVANLKHPLYRSAFHNLKHLEVIPLFEEVNTIMRSDEILQEYFEKHLKLFGFKPLYMRPYIARSDPALNAGLVPTVLAIKVGLSKYKALAEKSGIPLYPILGTAALPFRGGLSPRTVSSFIAEYPGLKTVLIQSAFRYDYPLEEVKAAIAQLHEQLPATTATTVSAEDEQDIKAVVSIFEPLYQSTIEHLATEINAVASQLPKRRERVQHVGLFGYSRGVGQVKLPRAIGFTAALYSLGVPPELISTGRGLKAAQEAGLLPLIERHYVNLKSDLESAGRYTHKAMLATLAKKSTGWKAVLNDVAAVEAYLGHELGPVTDEEKAHAKLVEKIHAKLHKGEPITTLIEKAAKLRRSLG